MNDRQVRSLRIAKMAAKVLEGRDEELNRLRDELKQLKADADRLDWLSEPLNEFAFPVRDHSTGEWWIYHDDDDEFTVSAPTLREAIDKAGKVAVDAKQREER